MPALRTSDLKPDAPAFKMPCAAAAPSSSQRKKKPEQQYGQVMIQPYEPPALDVVRIGTEAIKSGMAPLCSPAAWQTKQLAGAAALSMLQHIFPDYRSAIVGSTVSGLATDFSNVDAVLCLKGDPLADAGCAVDAFLNRVARFADQMHKVGSAYRKKRNGHLIWASPAQRREPLVKPSSSADKSRDSVLSCFGFLLDGPPARSDLAPNLIKLKHAKTGVTVRVW
jgi:hypothetical protein